MKTKSNAGASLHQAKISERFSTPSRVVGIIHDLNFINVLSSLFVIPKSVANHTVQRSIDSLTRFRG